MYAINKMVTIPVYKKLKKLLKQQGGKYSP